MLSSCGREVAVFGFYVFILFEVRDVINALPQAFSVTGVKLGLHFDLGCSD